MKITDYVNGPDTLLMFLFQEIDGASALVLQRRDVLQGLGLKLGPALKIYHHIKRLQTRRNFGLVA